MNAPHDNKGSRPLDQLIRSELRALAAETAQRNSYAEATFYATLAITAPIYTEMGPVAANYRGLEPERVSAARGDAAMHAGQDLLNKDAEARAVPPEPNVDPTIYHDLFDREARADAHAAHDPQAE